MARRRDSQVLEWPPPQSFSPPPRPLPQSPETLGQLGGRGGSRTRALQGRGGGPFPGISKSARTHTHAQFGSPAEDSLILLSVTPSEPSWPYVPRSPAQPLPASPAHSWISTHLFLPMVAIALCCGGVRPGFCLSSPIRNQSRPLSWSTCQGCPLEKPHPSAAALPHHPKDTLSQAPFTPAYVGTHPCRYRW